MRSPCRQRSRSSSSSTVLSSDRFPFAVSRGIGALQAVTDTTIRVPCDRYPILLTSSPLRVPDLLSRYGLLRPFSSLLPGYPLPQRATIYIIRVLLKARAPHASTCDPPGHESCFRGVSLRRGDQAAPGFPPTSRRLLSSLFCH